MQPQIVLKRYYTEAIYRPLSYKDKSKQNLHEKNFEAYKTFLVEIYIVFIPLLLLHFDFASPFFEIVCFYFCSSQKYPYYIHNNFLTLNFFTYCFTY